MRFLGTLGLLPLVVLAAVAQQPPVLVQARLTQPGSVPFHLKALIADKDDPEHPTQVEMFWMGPDKFRRTIESPDFSQTLVVNGSRVSEKDTERYMPMTLQTLTAAMVDPAAILKLVRPDDLVTTKANGSADESGRSCIEFQPGKGKICGQSRYGLAETIHVLGESLTFTEYQEFAGKRVARRLIYSPEHGYVLNAQIWTLEELKNPDESLFAVEQVTPKEERIRFEVIPEEELRSLGIGRQEIIWPQVLDGNTTGKASFVLSVDPDGIVRESAVLHSDNERANESARAQISKWKFKPVMRDGVSVQAKAILNFELNTRKYGPPEPLSDAEVRKLATNTVEPEYPPSVQGGGADCKMRIAVDVDGKLVEVIGGECPKEAWMFCYQAVGKWHFNPIVENGEQRPYRAEVVFKVP